MDMQVGGILGLLILVGAIYAIINIIQSRAENLHKVLWILLILFLPLLGLIIWFFAGPRGSNKL